MKITIKKELIEEVEVKLPLYLKHKTSQAWQIMIISEEELIYVSENQLCKQGIVGSYLGDDSFIPSTKKEFDVEFKKTVEKLTKKTL